MKFNTSWDKFKFFYHVAQAGSFSEAANLLHVTQSALSRSIKSLEDQLNVRLFDRLPRGVALTPKGNFLYESVCKIHDEFLKASRTLQSHETEPKGLLRIALIRRLVSPQLMQQITDFMKHYDEIKLKIVQYDQVDDFKSLKADVAIMPALEKSPHIIQECLGSVSQKFYASPHYISKHGMPSTVDSLKEHQLILFNAEIERSLGTLSWDKTKLSVDSEELISHTYIDSIEGMRHAAEAGFGIVPLIDQSTKALDGLIDVLPQFASQIPLYFITAPHLSTCKRIQLFKTHMQSAFQQKADSNDNTSYRPILESSNRISASHMY
ncbi:MAG: LysR family transcriptional regulator [Janthinobacterium lividum]